MRTDPKHGYRITHTYLDRAGKVKTRQNTSMDGATDAEAHDLFATHVRFALDAWKHPRVWNGNRIRIIGIALVDASGIALAEWSHAAEAQVAA